ncbi:hypothetical protein HQN86_12455 [Pedobacter panaciterrae]|uniref:MauE/DoxX family redox-associated membrane protein n=1 Tax=Pedobacter panaciterrae TaxID=363849 RepID=UPI00155DC51D|nr:MauE/DoxX family redox-associated membrane protein [Pedobacter panaciterrae]NQX54428.1 hypothetical protein [Pedobacter panaciterrae]
MSYKKKVIVTEIISALFILLFVYAAFSKIQDIEKFRVELGKSPLLNAFTRYIVYGIPFVELILSVLLAWKNFQYFALYVSFCLMAVFSAYIVAILNFSPYIPCSCGGILQNMSWKQHLLFNVCFMILGTFAILIYPQVDNKELIRDKKGNQHS